MWEIKLPWKSVVREQTTPQEWFYLISQPTWYPSLHGWVPKGIPPKAGPAVSKTGWPRMKLSLSVSAFGHFFLKFVIALCIWKFWFLQSWGITYFEKHHLILWCLLLINWDEVFWDKIPEPDDTSIFFFVLLQESEVLNLISLSPANYSPHGVTSHKFLPGMSDGFENAECQDLSQLI